MLRVIHPNRWFFWTIAGLVILGLVLIFFIVQTGKQLEKDSQDFATAPGELLSDPSYQGWKSFRSEAMGLTVKYPPSWQIEIDPLDESSFFVENPENFNENISISRVDPSLESVIRDSLQIANERVVEVNGVNGAWLSGVDGGDSATSNVVLFRKDGRLYYFAGQAQAFEKVINGIIFID